MSVITHNLTFGKERRLLPPFKESGFPSPRLFIKKIAGWFRDPFFWSLYEAERSPDSKAMTKLFEDYAKANCA